GPIRVTGEAIAAAVRTATAPIVAYAEEHSYPEPAWAEHLVEAHKGPWGAVSPAIVNANPKTGMSWASLFADFSQFMDPATSGETESLPWHHVSYKRAILMQHDNL